MRLRPELAAEVERFAGSQLSAPVLIAAHVRHPSHTVEQPDGRIAGTDAYLALVEEQVRRRGADPAGDGWRVFLGTDQERVLRRFQDAFGDQAVFYPDARRTRAAEDAAFDALSPAEQNREGHQLAEVSGYRRAIEWDRSMPDGQRRRAYDVRKLRRLGSVDLA